MNRVSFGNKSTSRPAAITTRYWVFATLARPPEPVRSNTVPGLGTRDYRTYCHGGSRRGDMVRALRRVRCSSRTTESGSALGTERLWEIWQSNEPFHNFWHTRNNILFTKQPRLCTIFENCIFIAYLPTNSGTSNPTSDNVVQYYSYS